MSHSGLGKMKMPRRRMLPGNRQLAAGVIAAALAAILRCAASAAPQPPRITPRQGVCTVRARCDQRFPTAGAD